MEQGHENIGDLDDLMNDNLCSNDAYVENDKVDCQIGVMDSHEEIEVVVDEVVGKLIEANGKESKINYDISSKEIDDSVLSDNDMFEDSFEKNQTDPEDEEYVLKSFKGSVEEKNLLSTDSNEIESTSSEEKSNQHCIFDLLQRNNDESLSEDGTKILIKATSVLPTDEEKTDSQSIKDLSPIHISSSPTNKAMNLPRNKKSGCDNQDLKEKLFMSQNTNEGNVVNVVETFENENSISNGIERISPDKLIPISNGHSNTENLDSIKEVDKDVIIGELDEKIDSGKDCFISKTLLADSVNCLEEEENNLHVAKMSQSVQNSNITENMGLHEEHDDELREESGNNDSIDACISEKCSNGDIDDKKKMVERDDIEKQDKSESYTDLSESVLQCNSEFSDLENKVLNGNNVHFSETVLASESNADDSLPDDFKLNNKISVSNEISSSQNTDLINGSPQSTSTADSVVVSSVGCSLRVSPRSLLNNSDKALPLDSPLKKQRNIDSIKLKTCHVNLKKVHVKDYLSPFQCKPNLFLLKRKLEDMLYESTKEEEIGIKEIKKMRQERSRAYGNLLKELTRVKNKIKNMK